MRDISRLFLFYPWLAVLLLNCLYSASFLNARLSSCSSSCELHGVYRSCCACLSCSCLPWCWSYALCAYIVSLANILYSTISHRARLCIRVTHASRGIYQYLYTHYLTTARHLRSLFPYYTPTLLYHTSAFPRPSSQSTSPFSAHPSLPSSPTFTPVNPTLSSQCLPFPPHSSAAPPCSTHTAPARSRWARSWVYLPCRTGSGVGFSWFNSLEQLNWT